MTCNIPYLDNNYQGEKLKKYRNKHIDVVKKTIASKLFYRREGHLQLSMDMSSTVRKQQEQFVESIPELSVVKSITDKDILSLKVDNEINTITNTLASTDNTEYNYSTQRVAKDENVGRFFNDNNKTTVAEALTKITNPELKLLADNLLKVLTPKQRNTTISLVDDGYYRGIISRITGEIQINRNANFIKGDSARTILHEIVHLVSLQYLDNNKDSALYKDFEKLFNHVKSKLEKENKPYYGISTIEEFITEALTNSGFISELASMDALEGIKEYENLFQEFVSKMLDILKKLFGVKDINLYNQVSAIASQIISLNTDIRVEDIGLTSFDEQVFYDMDSNSNKENSEFGEYLDSESNQDTFLKIVSDIKSKLDNYIELITDGAIDYPSTQREIKLAELKNLKNLLSDADLTDAVTGISKLITQSVNWIDIIDEEFFGYNEKGNLLQRYKAVQEQDITGLTDEQLIERDTEITFLSKSLNKSKHFLYLFDSLEEFHNELKRGGFIAADKFNTKLRDKAIFDKEILAIMKKHNEEIGIVIADEKLQEMINVNYALLNEGNKDIIELKQSIVDSFIDKDTATINQSDSFKLKLDEVFARNVSKTFNAQMSYSLSKAENIKKELKDLHYKVTTEWLYPDYEKIQNNLNLKDGDELYLSKAHFTALLKIAESEENVISNWLEATIQNKDPLVATLSNKITKAINAAHFDSVTDAQEISKARTESGFDKMSEEERQEAYDEMTNMITVLKETSNGRPIEIDINSDEEGLFVSTLFGRRKYATTKVKAFKTGKHTSLAQAQSKLVDLLLYSSKDGEPSLVNDLLEKAINENGELTPEVLFDYLIANKDFEVSGDLRAAFFNSDSNGNVYTDDRFDFRKEIYEKTGEERKKYIKEQIRSVTRRVLYTEKVVLNKSGKDVFEILTNAGIDYKNIKEKDLVFLFENSNAFTEIERFIKQIGSKKFNADNTNIFNITSNGSVLYAYMSKKDKKFKFGEFDKDSDFSDVEHFYYKSNELTDLQDAYKLPEYNGNHKDYFNFLYSKYKKSNKALGYKRLKHGIVPQVQKTGVNLKDVPQESYDFLQRIYNWFVDAYKHIKDAWIAIDNDEAENVEEKKTFEQQYLNGEKVRSIAMPFTSMLENQSNLEKDLATSLLAYAPAINTYQALKKYDSEIQLARTVIAGDTLLGIERRQAKKRTNKGDLIGRVKGGVNNAFAKQTSDNLNQKILEYIDDMVYGQSEYNQFDLGIFNSEQFKNTAGFVTAYSSLAFNVIGSMGNLSAGKISTYLESIQGSYFDKATWGKAEAEYFKNIYTHFKDYAESDVNKKSKTSQLTMILDAIQGEFLDSFDDRLRMRRFSDIPKTALFFTQSAPEHSIQVTNMIAMLMAKKDSNGVSLWERIPYTEGEGIVLTKELKKELLEFQGTLHSVNKRLNGAYAKNDKSRLQRRWFGSLALAFRKYIYPYFMTRFGDERIDIESEQLIRGYVRSYYQELLADIKSNRTFAYKALKVFKQVGTDTVRFAAGTANTLTFGALGKAVDLNKLTGIDKLEYRRMKEAQRYIAEVSMFTSLTFISMVLAAMTSDDDDEDKGLKLLELIAKRQKADMGAFLPTMVNIPTGNVIPGFASWDFTKRLISSPIPAMRVYDNSVSLLSQLTGVDYSEEGIDFSYNDVYSKKGPGYEKGDLKITRLAQKSIIAPYWQLLKLGQADYQLQYLESVNKNSK